MGNNIPYRYPLSCEDPLWYTAVVKLVHILHSQFFIDVKSLEYYHVQGIAGKCYDMQLIAIEVSQQRVKLHDPNR
jgi:hypothetical protein